MLDPIFLFNIISLIRSRVKPKTAIFVYTAKTDNDVALLWTLVWADGITVTLHKQSDVEPFLKFAKKAIPWVGTKSLRLNVFKGIKMKYPKGWIVKDNMVWQKNCPLPKDEVFMRL